MSLGDRTAHYYEFGSFRLEPENHLLWRGGKPIDLPPKAFELLLALVENSHRVLPKGDLLQRIWPDTFVDENNLPRTISTLRKILGDACGSFHDIKTVPKCGYRLLTKVREVRDGNRSAERAWLDSLPSAAQLLPREQDVRSVLRDLTNYPVTTIVAPPGYGKTSLAILVAAELHNQFRDGLWFVPLDSLLDSADERAVVRAIAAILGEKTEHESIPALVRLLRRQSLLLILDACETVLDHCEAVVSALVLSCPDLKVLATTRQALGVSGERIQHLLPLDLPKEADDWSALDELLCVSLFKRIAERIGCVLPADAPTASHVASICRLTEGIPLAIELAASMTSCNSLAEISEGLSHDFRLGGSQETKLHRRIARSHHLLSPSAEVLFRRLAVISGGWTKEAAKAICSNLTTPAFDIEQALQQLVQGSLVTREHARSRYRMLDMIRCFALSKLQESGEEAAISRAHFEYFRHLSERAGKEAWETNMSAALATMDVESSNVRRAMEWSFLNCPAEGAALCAALWPYWAVVGQLVEGREQLKAFLTAPARCSNAVYIRAWTGLGVLAYFQSDYEEGIMYCEKSLDLSVGSTDRWATCVNLVAAGSMRFTQRHDYAGALHAFVESVALAEEIAEPWLLSLALGNLAVHRAYLAAGKNGEVSDAETKDIVDGGVSSVDFGRKSGNSWILSLSLLNHATSLRLLASTRDWEVIESLIRESFQLRYDIGDKYGVIQSLYKLAAVACERRAAEQYIRAAILLGGLSNLLGGRERIPIPRRNEADFEWTVSTCKSALGEEEYQIHFRSGATWSLDKVARFALNTPRIQVV